MFIKHKGSEILVVHIQRRKDIPHAIVKKTNTGEIKTRKYYIRTVNGKRLVDDITLNYLFKFYEDPVLELLTNIEIWYNFKDLIFFQPLIYSTYSFYLLPFLQDIQNSKFKSLLISDTNNMKNLLLEIIPYSFLIFMSTIFPSSWKVKIEKQNSKEIISPIDSYLQNEKIDIFKISTKGIKLIEDYVNFNQVFEFRNNICLPKKTKIKIEKNTSTSTIILNNPKFKIDISFNSSYYHRTLPRIISTNYSKIQDIFACFNFDVRFKATFKFPDQYDDFFDEHYYFARILREQINEKWNWDKNISIIKNDMVDKMNKNILKILSILNNSQKK